MPQTKATLIDDLDDRLLRLLDRNPRYTNRRLAALAGVTEVTVANRIRRLSDSRIARVVGSHDPRGDDVLSFSAFISIAERDHAAVGDELASLDGCRSVSLVSGPCDIVATFTAPDTQSMRHLIEQRIAMVAGVTAIESELCLDVIGYRDGWGKLF